MSNNINVKITGEIDFEKYGKEIAELAEAEISDTILNIQSGAVTDAPVDEGVLRRSIRAETVGLEGKVWTRVPYAPYQEFGTGGLVDVPPGWEEYAIKFKGAGIRQVNMKPQPFLYPNFFKYGKELIVNLDKGIGSLTKK